MRVLACTTAKLVVATTAATLLVLGQPCLSTNTPFAPTSAKKGLTAAPKMTATRTSSPSPSAFVTKMARGGDAHGSPDMTADDTSSSSPSSVGDMAVSAVTGLTKYMSGPKADTLLLLMTTALNTPLCKMLGQSPILGFLALGVLFGPNGYNLVKDIHTTEMMADIGIVFFLFEMGIHLDFKTLMSMRKDVFGFGGSQFLVTAAVVAFIAKLCGMSTAAQIVLGGGLALSSSAFVLQLLKDKDQMNTKFGRSSFGVLLLQDLAVVPLLVVTPILAGGGDGLATALGSAGIKAAIALSTIAVIGTFLLKPFFGMVAKTKSQEAFVAAILSTVLGMSFLTEGLGLSNTLGAFLAGMLLSETPHCHDIEKEVAPFRGILVGLFFFSVGFEIDIDLIKSSPGLVASIVLGIAALKATIAGILGLVFGLSKGTAQRVGLILSQGGEFAFVAFRLARSHGILDGDLTKLMLTCVSLTMGLTPFLDDFGAKMAETLDGPPPKGKKAIKRS
mmetsp:Transcript_27000/g.64463  ORF Transcript_27000/g.64463 Transcript_27000/m.64463 type:complete len:503 (-) Transcript_27000:1356-2864(-)